ncbi:peroxide/acid stress response protein YhcN [Enterobacter sp. Bisph1]|uniref:peroxide/acid stress response protein YhcN n=1 Tax=Enterobacter sp. Bisph1 TaxID=1274399 RepID=UPI00057C2B3D|nr:peroxide/acid stress response protein YhcN [Enterobacter sp. Bisph1]
MKRNLIIASLGFASLVSFAAGAATLVTNDQASNLQSMGNITVSQKAGVPMDIRQEISDKADRAGASSYRIIEARTGDSTHITAEMYK